jgi:F0F1-type ATP synthase epsilon subunit
MAKDLPTMNVKIYAPFRTYFEGLAESLSAANKTGPFDVLPHHKNFMTLLVPCTVTVRASGKPDFSLDVSRAVMHVKTDQVTVFLDI